MVTTWLSSFAAITQLFQLFASISVLRMHCKDSIPKIRSKYSHKMKLHGLSPNSYIHVYVSYLYIPTIALPNLLQENWWTDRGNI
jgi:hypothetical protein